jgi:4'-phosphopantetheinyl transferase
VTLAPPEVGCFDRADEVHVWVIRPGTAMPDALTPLLAADEIERAARFHFHRDRARFIVRRAHLRRLLGAYLDQDPAAVHFATTGPGKPVLAPPGSDLHFSVSHSGDIAVCVVGRDHPVGIDVEHIRPGIEDGLVSRVCTSNERAALARIPANARPAAFFALWTHKEALVKADGRGLSLPVATIDVARALTDGNVDTRLPGPEGDAAYAARAITLDGAVAAAVARRSPTITVHGVRVAPTG